MSSAEEEVPCTTQEGDIYDFAATVGVTPAQRDGSARAAPSGSGSLVMQDQDDAVYSNSAAFEAGLDEEEDYVNNATCQDYRQSAIASAQRATAAQHAVVRKQEEAMAAGLRKRPQPPPAYIKPPLTRSDDMEEEAHQDEAMQSDDQADTGADTRVIEKAASEAPAADIALTVSEPAEPKAARSPSLHQRRSGTGFLQPLELGMTPRPTNAASAIKSPATAALDASPRTGSPRRGAPLPGKVIAAYTACSAEELTLKEGEILNVTSYPSDTEWWHGRMGRGQEGRFPASCVELQARPKKGARKGASPARPTDTGFQFPLVAAK